MAGHTFGSKRRQELSTKGLGLVCIGVVLGLVAVFAGISHRRQSQQVEQLLADFYRERVAHGEEDRQRWESYVSLSIQSRARIEEMAKAIQQLRSEEKEIRLGIAKVAEQRSKEESRLASEDSGEVAASIRESLGLTAPPVEQNGGLFFPLPISRQLAAFAVGCRADQAELALQRQDCQNLRGQLFAGESAHAELQNMVKTAQAALTSEKAARQREAEECQRVVKSLTNAARRGFWGKVWDRTKVVLAFAAGAVVGRLAH